jgi:protein tyrosine phosphatase
MVSLMGSIPGFPNREGNKQRMGTNSYPMFCFLDYEKITVFCFVVRSAGIGRTGCFAATSIGMKQIQVR